MNADFKISCSIHMHVGNKRYKPMVPKLFIFFAYYKKKKSDRCPHPLKKKVIGTKVYAMKN